MLSTCANMTQVLQFAARRTLLVARQPDDDDAAVLALAWVSAVAGTAPRSPTLGAA